MRQHRLLITLVTTVSVILVLGWRATGSSSRAAATRGMAHGAVDIQVPRRISLASPFSGPCTRANPGFTRGFAQETSVAVDPRDPRHILVSWIQDGRASDLVMASRDGGRSFSQILIPRLSACTGGAFQVASDPGVAFSADGRVAYFSGIVADFRPSSMVVSQTSMRVSRSFDGGFSWSVPSVIQPPTGNFWDKPELTTDPRRPGVAYYAYDLRRAPDFLHGYSLLSRTTDGGRSWSRPRKLYDPHSSDSWPGTSQILVNRDESLLDVFALITNGRRARELAIRSTDGGRTWGKPVTIGRSSGRPVTDPVTHKGLNTFDMLPSQTVAPNGDVYVSWLQPGANNAASRIAVARSADGGRHWSRRALAVRGQAALPTIGVAGDGTVGVLYYVIAPASRGGYWPARVALATSPNPRWRWPPHPTPGRHWTRHRVAGPFNLLTTGSKARPCCYLGDYEGMARLPHGLAAAFSMGKPIARHRVDVYFTRITTSR